MNRSKVREQRFWMRWSAAGAVESYWHAEDRLIAKMREDSPGLAVVRKIDGQLVLDDPVALAVMRSVAKHNCRGMFNLSEDRVTYFKQRIADRGLNAEEMAIIFLNVDDVHGGPITDVLMPGANWQQYRDVGQVPIARGLVDREAISEIIFGFDPEAAAKLKETSGPAVLVVDHGVAEVFAV